MTATADPVRSLPPSTSGSPDGPRAATARTPDPRYLALRNFALSISAFNVFGYTLLGFEQPWLWPILAIAVAYATEIVFELISAWSQERQPRFLANGARGAYEFLLPAHITALAVNMLLYANNQFWPIAFGVVVAVSQKYVLRAPVKGTMRHFMNPSNSGIVLVLLCFGSWVSIAPPYMFTEWASTYFKLMIPMVILVSGTVINALLTKRIALIVGWMGGFAIQAFVRHWIWGVQLNTALSVMTGVAFVLFTNYMITDPGTTPSRGRAQFMFGGSVAFTYAVLMQLNIVYTLFFATAIVCAFRGAGWWGAAAWQRIRARDARPGRASLPDGVPVSAVTERAAGT